MNRQNANVINATQDTLAAKLSYQPDFAPPVSLLSLQSAFNICDIREYVLALRGTETGIGWLSAYGALAGTAPAVREVTIHTTKTPLLFLDRIGVGLKGLLTMLTGSSDLCLEPHADKYTMSVDNMQVVRRALRPVYFEIARRRIEAAQQQLRLPI